jgi:glycosyltransferase involved in cell wall biosynthesis
MSFSLPVVGTRIAGVPEQVADGVTGLLVEPGDEQGLADALETLLKSPALRREMGQKGRERVERLFSTDAYVAGVTEVYRDLLGSRKKGR